MEVILKAPQKIGNRSYPKGKVDVPDSLLHEIGFKKLVASGAIQLLPRSPAQQKILMARDAKNLQKAQAARIAKGARSAQRPSQSAKAVSGANPSSSTLLSAAGANQPLPTPAKSIPAGAAAQASAPAAPVTAQKKG